MFFFKKDNKVMVLNFSNFWLWIQAFKFVIFFNLYHMINSLLKVLLPFFYGHVQAHQYEISYSRQQFAAFVVIASIVNSIYLWFHFEELVAARYAFLFGIY